MKQQFFLSLLILVIVSLSSVNSHKTRTAKKPTKAASFITYFLRNFNIGKSKRSLKRVVLEDCPRLKKSKLVRNVYSELYRMHVGLIRLNKAKINASRIVKRKIDRIKRLNVLTLVRSILKRINRCVVTPWKVRRYIKNVVRKMKKVSKGNCKSEICSTILSYRNVRRMTKAWAYLIGIGRDRPRAKSTLSFIKEKKKKNKNKKQRKQHKYDWPRIKVVPKDYHYQATLKRLRLKKLQSRFARTKSTLKNIAGLLAFFVKVFNKIKTF